MADTTKDKDGKRQALPMGSATLGLAGLGQLGQLGFGNVSFEIRHLMTCVGCFILRVLFFQLLQSTGTFNLATLLAAQQAGMMLDNGRQRSSRFSRDFFLIALSLSCDLH